MLFRILLFLLLFPGIAWTAPAEFYKGKGVVTQGEHSTNQKISLHLTHFDNGEKLFVLTIQLEDYPYPIRSMFTLKNKILRKETDGTQTKVYAVHQQGEHVGTAEVREDDAALSYQVTILKPSKLESGVLVQYGSTFRFAKKSTSLTQKGGISLINTKLPAIEWTVLKRWENKLEKR